MKRRGCLTGLLIVIVVIGAAAAAMAIFLPGFFGPKFLDVEISQKAYESAVAKLENVSGAAPAAGKAGDAGGREPLKAINTSLTSEELTSYINYGSPDSYGMKQMQIRINKDDTLEISGAVDTDYLLEDVLEGGYDREDIKKAMPMLGLLPKSVNIYSRIGFEITNGQTSNLTVNDIQVMGVGVPEDIYEEAKTGIGYILGDFIKELEQKTGADYNSVRIRDGRLVIKGEAATDRAG